MGYALSEPYVNEYFSDESKADVRIDFDWLQSLRVIEFRESESEGWTREWRADRQVTAMIANLKVAFKSLVDDATWMDDDTKVVAREKADYMSQFVGYPDWVKNKTALEAYYDGVSALRFYWAELSLFFLGGGYPYCILPSLLSFRKVRQDVIGFWWMRSFIFEQSSYDNWFSLQWKGYIVVSHYFINGVLSDKKSFNLSINTIELLHIL